MSNYLTVTEIPGNKASKEQIGRLFHRYHFAMSFCHDKDVLEVACGAGMGLGYLETVARKIVGGDIEEEILSIPTRYYQQRSRIEIRRIDAQDLPFEDNSFDVVLLFEAIYYLPRPERFIEESFRVLRAGGKLIIGSVNREWSDFNPSPFSHKYFSIPEIFQILRLKYSDIQFSGAFFAEPDSLKAKGVSLIKRFAVRLHLMPKTMKGKELLKRLFFGGLVPIPPEIVEDMAEYVPPIPLSKETTSPKYKVIYAVAGK